MNPGEIYRADIPEAGVHNIVVVSREDLNRGKKVSAVVITSGKFAVRSQLPNCVVLRAGEFGMNKDCVIQCETLAPIPKDVIDLDGGPIAALTDEVMRDVIKAIGHVLDSDCEPR
jgi:mRNA-degrading endonuclease toxin of MazEF toxin-antitoxin module